MPDCDRCGKWYRTWGALWQHKQDSPRHNQCDNCEVDFTTWTGLQQHWIQSPRHAYCQYCDEHFDDRDDLYEHYDDEHWWCSKCRKVFKDEVGLEQHYRQSENHHYCVSCKRDFRSENNLDNHLNSSTHKPRTVGCPFGGCGQSFISRSHLVLHLESGRCPSGVDRPTINRVVRQYDKKNIITDPSRLLTGPGGSYQDTRYSANERAWNGWAYECYICNKTHGTLVALNQHLGSPVHQAKFYICPLSSCKQRFPTLSGLCQHIESQKCGVVKFRAVRDALDDVMGKMKLLTV